uniref:Uncharacterized protein n=1 Tax=Anopheles quadriannulatus TaxID=34691 RepID=A0A182XQX6_ANOQN
MVLSCVSYAAVYVSGARSTSDAENPPTTKQQRRQELRRVVVGGCCCRWLAYGRVRTKLPAVVTLTSSSHRVFTHHLACASERATVCV